MHPPDLVNKSQANSECCKTQKRLYCASFIFKTRSSLAGTPTAF